LRLSRGESAAATALCCVNRSAAAQTVSKYRHWDLRPATRGRSRREREGRACQATISPCAALMGKCPVSWCRRGKKIRYVMLRKRRAAARIGAIERQWPGFPAKPDHGAPLLHDGVLFGQEHASSPFTRTASINAGAGSLPKPANALGGCSSTYEICHIRQTSAEPTSAEQKFSRP